jgi:hypothetical protein
MNERSVTNGTSEMHEKHAMRETHGRHGKRAMNAMNAGRSFSPLVSFSSERASMATFCWYQARRATLDYPPESIERAQRPVKKSYWPELPHLTAAPV